MVEVGRAHFDIHPLPSLLTKIIIIRLRDMAVFACHDDWRLFLDNKYTIIIVLDMIINDIVHEPLASSDNYLTDWSNFL